jgi:phosphoribosylformylglycinamidine (FGAM) synthase PurS component
MDGNYLVEVSYKDGAVNPSGRGLAEDVRHLGVRGVARVATSQL